MWFCFVNDEVLDYTKVFSIFLNLSVGATWHLLNLIKMLFFFFPNSFYIYYA